MAVNVAAVSVLFTVVWIVAVRRGLIEPSPDAGGRLDIVTRGLAPAVVFLASIPIAYLVDPDIARLSWVALLVVDPIVPRLTARMRRPDDGT
jgi:hypothetical protein